MISIEPTNPQNQNPLADPGQVPGGTQPVTPEQAPPTEPSNVPGASDAPPATPAPAVPESTPAEPAATGTDQGEQGGGTPPAAPPTM